MLRSRTTLLVLLGLCLPWSAAWALPYQVPSQDVVRFPGAHGPRHSSVVATAEFTSWRVYAGHSTSSLAILLTARHSNWLGIAHGLKSIGVPFIITRDYKAALTHRVVLVYPHLYGSVLAQAAIKALQAFPRAGGTLITSGAAGAGLNNVFGIGRVEASRSETQLTFSASALAPHGGARFRTLQFSGPPSTGNAMGVYRYLQPLQTPLARFDDGAAAIVRRRYRSGGVAYAIGLDLGYLMLRGYGDHAQGTNPHYDDHFDPVIDGLLRFIKAVYTRGEPLAVTFWTAPDNEPLSVVLTHDVDFAGSVPNMRAYAELEYRNHVSATYFMQTKYIKDWEDRAFFDDAAVKDLHFISDLGMNLGSHSVAHAPNFNHFPIGTGREHYPSYLPFVASKTTTYNASVLGELRVSRFLLHHFFPQQSVRAFRAGYLLKPVVLPQALAAAGYRYDSSATADESLTHLPFQLNFNRGYHQEVPVFEFPITLEDQVKPSMLAYYPHALTLARELGQYGALCLVLIHPNITGEKYAFEHRFLHALRGHAWIGSLGRFGHWWRARNDASVTVTSAVGHARVTLTLPVAIRGLTLSVPPGWVLAGSPTGVQQFGQRVVLPREQGPLLLRFRLPSPATAHAQP